MRTFLSVVLFVLGALLLLPGAVVAVVAGPDDTASFDAQDVPAASGVAVTAHDMLPVENLTLHVTATSKGGPVFLGTAHPVDALDYVKGVEATWVRGVERNGELMTDPVEGELPAPEADPTTLTFWNAHATGTGPRSLDVELTGEPETIVVVPVGGPASTTLAFGVVLPNIFRVALAVAGAGLLLVVLGVLVLLRGRRRRKAGSETHGDAPSSTAGADEPAAREAAPVDPALLPTPPRGTSVVARRASRRRRPALVLAVGASVAVASACVPIPSEVELPESPTKPAVREEDLAATLEEFSARVNEAENQLVASPDATPWATVLSEGLLEVNTFRVELDKERGEAFTPEPGTYELVDASVPDYGAYPMTFLATADWKAADGAAAGETGAEADGDAAAEDDTNSLVVLKRPRAHEPWRASSMFQIPAGSVTFPDDYAAPTPEQVTAALAAVELLRTHIATGQAVDMDLGNVEGVRSKWLGWAESSDDVSVDLAEAILLGAPQDPVAPGGPVQVVPVEEGVLVNVAITGIFHIKAAPGITLHFTDPAFAKLSRQTGEDRKGVRILGVVHAAILLPTDGTRARVIGGGYDHIAPRA